jgi:hypothetical protein
MEPAQPLHRPQPQSGAPAVRPSRDGGRSFGPRSLLRVRWIIGGLVGLTVGAASVAAIHCLPFQIVRVFAFLTSPILVTVQLVKPGGAAAAALLLLASPLLYAVYGVALVDRGIHKLRWPWLIAILTVHCACHVAWNGLLIRDAIAGLLP